MNEFYQELFAERIGGVKFGTETELYKFEKIKRAKRVAKEKNKDLELIDLGVGEPDEPAANEIAEVLRKNCGLSENRFYADNGIIEFQKAASEYMDKVYKIKGLDPEKNIIHGIGSKPILAMIPSIFINSEDYSLVTSPG